MFYLNICDGVRGNFLILFDVPVIIQLSYAAYAINVYLISILYSYNIALSI